MGSAAARSPLLRTSSGARGPAKGPKGHLETRLAHGLGLPHGQAHSTSQHRGTFRIAEERGAVEDEGPRGTAEVPELRDQLAV